MRSRIAWFKYRPSHPAEAGEHSSDTPRTMLRENAEIVRQGNDAISRRDKVAWLATTDPDAVMVPARQWPEEGPIRGAEAIWDFYVQVAAAWEERPYELGDFVEAGGDALIVNVRREARGKTSGATVEFNYWAVMAFRRGRTARIEWFADRAEALEAAGLSE
jgi:ketosteroid isomerase-like protein